MANIEVLENLNLKNNKAETYIRICITLDNGNQKCVYLYKPCDDKTLQIALCILSKSMENI